MTTKEQFDKMTDEQKLAALNAAEKDLDSLRQFNQLTYTEKVKLENRLDIIKQVINL